METALVRISRACHSRGIANGARLPALLLIGSLSCSGCSSSSNEPLISLMGTGVGNSGTVNQRSARSLSFGGKRLASNQQAAYYYGEGDVLGSGISTSQDPAFRSGPPITLNLADASINAAAKVVMSDILGLSYSIASGLEGTITIQTSQPVSRSELIRLFQDALATNGAAIVRSGKTYRIDRIEQIRNAMSGVVVDDGRTGGDQVGAGMRVVRLRYVSASEMLRILEPMAGRAVVVAADDSRNTLTLSGTGQEIATILEAISVFDVDVMKGMSFAVVPVRSARADSIAAELEKVFDQSGSKGMVRILPNNRLRSILVSSTQRSYLARAEMWIRRLDTRAEGHEKQLFTYKVQNRSAKDLVAIVSGMLSPDGDTQTSQESRSVAPRFEEATLQSNGFDAAEQASASDDSAQTSLDATEAASTAATSDEERVKVTADEANNALLILAAPEDYKRVEAILQELDVSPRQVLIEATIAEVSLNDELKFGVRWYLRQNTSQYMFTDMSSKAFGSTFPGFSYALQAANVQATLDALNKVTNVAIVSAPSLMVLDNRTASLQIGDQVPIVTQSATSVAGENAPVVNSVSYRDTGVILQITPRVNDNGRVLLDIEQEVSSVAGTTSSGIDSPTIRQRKIKTSVMVDDGQVLTLGGIIQNQKSRGANKIPLLGDIPLIGNAFKSKTNTIGKTELIILLTPRVVRDAREAHEATQEYQKRLGFSAGGAGEERERDMAKTAKRLFE